MVECVVNCEKTVFKTNLFLLIKLHWLVSHYLLPKDWNDNPFYIRPIKLKYKFLIKIMLWKRIPIVWNICEANYGLIFGSKLKLATQRILANKIITISVLRLTKSLMTEGKKSFIWKQTFVRNNIENGPWTGILKRLRRKKIQIQKKCCLPDSHTLNLKTHKKK